MAERNTQLESRSVIQAAEDICRESAEGAFLGSNAVRATQEICRISYDLALAKRLDADWDKDAGDLGQKNTRLDWLRTLKRDLIQAGEEGTDCFIHTGVWLKILEGDLKEIK